MKTKISQLQFVRRSKS